MQDRESAHLSGWRAAGHEIIFESDTPAGKAFDVALIFAIFSSIVVVMLESVATIQAEHGAALTAAEWVLTGLFTVEYILRLLCVGSPKRYARSFFGLVDLFSILPTFASLLVPGTQALVVIRTVRILRVFRVLKLANYVRESETMMRALVASRRKIEVFLSAVLMLVVISGSLMYVIEGPENGFTSIPRGIYWAIVTLTTVGYGDIAPQTNLGQAISAMIMIMGYGIIAVPTGIVSVQMARAENQAHTVSGQACPSCGGGGHASDAEFCRLCGARM
jgi:voltage-gated potassium channel